jgi:hypothetical protein
MKKLPRLKRGIPRPRTVAERARENIIYIFYFLRARRAKSKRSRRPCGSRAPAAGLRCVCSASDKYTHTHTNQLARAHKEKWKSNRAWAVRDFIDNSLIRLVRILKKQNPNRVRKCDDLWWSKCARCSWEKVFAFWSIFLNYTLWNWARRPFVVKQTWYLLEALVHKRIASSFPKPRTKSAKFTDIMCSLPNAKRAIWTVQNSSKKYRRF